MDILVVDDDRDIADIIGYSLRKEGHRPILAYSGEEALAIAERQRPDLVVLDVMLPRLSGFDVCRKLRERGLGSYRDLLLGVSKDSAMLIWLDGNTNRKNAPNENYGRELLELFTLGIGNYAEEDVVAAAALRLRSPPGDRQARPPMPDGCR